MKRRPLRIGITAGDVNGIGPEVALKAANQLQSPDLHVTIIGSVGIIAEQANRFHQPPVTCWNPHPEQPLHWRPGTIQRDASRAAHAWITCGVHACLTGELDALVTAPISKEGFHRAGIDTPGHTELLARLTHTPRFAMMLFGGPLRVVLATRHIPIRDVPDTLTRRLIIEQATLLHQGLAWMGLRKRRIAVCGLNPHAGEGGDIGTEDLRIIAPAVKALQKNGIKAYGPLPGDTVFHQAATGTYDAVLAMYHDQGLAPLKLIAFESGVNLTLGLPIVRTSPDHGTAYAIAGRNIANPSSMIAAIQQAALLARRANPWKAL